MAQGDSLTSQAERIATKLESLRGGVADLPEEERIDRFREALREEIGDRPEDAAGSLLEAVRDRLIHHARDREQRVDAMETRVLELQSQLDSAVQERDRLKRENEELKARPAPTPAAPVAAVGTADRGLLDAFRDGLRQMTDEQEVTAESLGLPAQDARLFRMIQALLGFALNYEVGLNMLLTEFNVGPVKDMDTRQMKTFIQLVRQRFRACLDDEKGSIGALREILDRNSRFLIDLNTAYTACIYDGSKSMLSSIDPPSTLEKHKRMMGHDHEGAFKELRNEHGELTNRSRTEMWRDFFYQPFREKLHSYLEQ